MIWTLAPVSFSKSGARRCSGSAIWGPVNVTTRIVVPANDWFDDVAGPLLQAARTPTPTNRTRALARTRLMSLFPLLLRNKPPGLATVRPIGISDEYWMF